MGTPCQDAAAELLVDLKDLATAANANHGRKLVFVGTAAKVYRKAPKREQGQPQAGPLRQQGRREEALVAGEFVEYDSRSPSWTYFSPMDCWCGE